MTEPADAGPVLHVSGFDGPLDLLLDLAERQRIDLSRIPLADLVEQFLAALAHLAERTPIERRAEWVVLAARLLQLRSRLLFPADPAEAAAAAQDAAAELARLRTLAQMRAAAAWLEDRPHLNHDVFARPPPAEARPSGYVALMQACLAVLRGRDGDPADAPRYRPVMLEEFWRVADALALIRARLTTCPPGATLRHFLPQLPPGQPARIRAAIASTLVASLEMARGGEVHLHQPGYADEIQIERMQLNPDAR
jgi:segregation and condensation protein A